MFDGSCARLAEGSELSEVQKMTQGQKIGWLITLAVFLIIAYFNGPWSRTETPNICDQNPRSMECDAWIEYHSQEERGENRFGLTR